MKEIFPVRVRQRVPGPHDGLACMRVEICWLVQTRGHSIVISTDANGTKTSNQVDGFDRIRSVSDEVSAAKRRIVGGLFRPLDAGFEGFDVGVYVTEDEVAHGV
jgi:hypothetical protein